MTTWTASFLVVLGLAFTVWLVLRRCAESEATVYVSPGLVLTSIQVIDYIALAGSLVMFLTGDMPAWMFDVICVAALTSVGLMFYMKRMNRLDSPEAEVMMRKVAQQGRLMRMAQQDALEQAEAAEATSVATAAEVLSTQPARQVPTKHYPSLPAPYLEGRGRRGRRATTTQQRTPGLPAPYLSN